MTDRQKPTSAQRAYLMAKIRGEEYKTTPQGRSRIQRSCLEKGFLCWSPRGHFSTLEVTTSGKAAAITENRESTP